MPLNFSNEDEATLQKNPVDEEEAEVARQTDAARKRQVRPSDMS